MDGAANNALWARALTTFKEVVELDDDARRAALAGLEPALREAVDALLAEDAAEASLFDGHGQGERLLAADMLVSMVARSEVVPAGEHALPTSIGRYRVVGVLGRGGMGVVYEAEQDQPRRRVAIKTVHPWLRSAAAASRFELEVQALASLRHRSVPRLYEVIEEAGATWAVMELVRGVPIDVHLKGRRESDKLSMLLEVLDGVEHAHQAGIVHRDLKPANILVADGQPRILDFGLARTLSADGDRLTDGVIGTLAYMAPEQLSPRADDIDAQGVAQRVDLHALGVIAFELLTGELPANARAADLAELRRAKARPVLPEAVPLARDLGFILARAMAPEARDRYASAAELAADVRNYLALRPVAARPATVAYRTRLWLARHRSGVRAFLATLAAVVLVAGLTLGVRACDAARAAAERERLADDRLRRFEAESAELQTAGRGDEAETLFRVFAGMPENAGTRALHAAYLRRAARQREAGRRAAALDSDASAFAVAVDPAGQIAALEELGAAFMADGAWAKAELVLARLEALGGDAEDLGVRIAILRRDFAGALARSNDGEHGEQTSALAQVRPLLAALAEARPLGVVAAMADVRPGGELVLIDDPQRNVSVRDRAGHLTALPLPDDMAIGRDLPRVVSGSDQWFIGQTAAGAPTNGTLLYELSSSPVPKWSRIALIPLADLNSAVALPGPHGPLLCIGSAGNRRELMTWRRDATGAEVLWRAPPEVAGPPSDVDSLIAVDVDGDGREEIVGAFGAWAAYDVRVLRPNDDGSLALAARSRLGSVSQLLVMLRPGAVPLIALAKADRYPSPTLFGAATPFGAKAGMHLLEWAPAGTGAAGLRAVDYAPYPPMIVPSAGATVSKTGDFDGDGIGDLAVTLSHPREPLLALYRGQRVGNDVHLGAPFLVRGVSVLASGNLDDDAADELVVRLVDDGQAVWILGLSGAGRMPVLPPGSSLPAAAVAGEAGRDASEAWVQAQDPALGTLWRTARELAAMGLDRQAADRLEGAARLATDRVSAARFVALAGELRMRNGEPREAVRLFEAALANDPTSTGARLGAARGYLELHALDAAVRHFEALGETASDTVAEAAKALAWLAPIVRATAPEAVVQTGRWLAPEWHLQAPESFAKVLGPVGALALEVFSEHAPLMTLPLHYPGGALALEADVVLEHLEMGAVVALELRPVGGGPVALSVEIRGRGGGLVIERLVGCGPWDDHFAPESFRNWEVAGPLEASGEPLTLRVGYVPGMSAADGGAGDARCDLSASGEALVARRYPVTPLAPGDYELVVAATGEEAWHTAARMALKLNRLTLRGLTVRSVAPAPLAASHRLAFQGAVAAALAAYSEGAAQSPIDRLRSEVALGAFEAARATSATLGRAWVDERRALHLLRQAPQIYAPLIDEPDLASEALVEAWDVALRYLDQADVQALLRLPQIAALTGRTPDELRLMVAAARSFIASGEPARAGRIVERARENGALDGELAPELELIAAVAAHAVGDADATRRHLAAWKARVPLFELALEGLAHQPDYAALVPLVP